MKRVYKDRIDIIDMRGQQIHDLTVVEYAAKGKCRGANWLCRCVCGNECIVSGGHLRSGKRKSCGCRSEARIEETGINKVYANYKRKAKVRDIEFGLNKDDFGRLIKGNCAYCNSPASQVLKRQKSRKIQILYNGIDRVNTDKGYIIENCVSCCRYCNQSKSDLTLEQWKEHLKRIYRWLIDS